MGIADIKDYQGQARLFGVEENAEAVDELQRKLLTEFQPAIEGLRLQRISCTLHNGSSQGTGGQRAPAGRTAQPARPFHRQWRHLQAAGCEQRQNERGRGDGPVLPAR